MSDSAEIQEAAAAPVKLEFQNFGTSGEGSAIDGKISSSSAPAPFKPPPSDNVFGASSDQQSLLGGFDGSKGRNWNPISLTTYQQYFDVDTADIIARLRRSVSPSATEKFFSNEVTKPDLYGPFWLCTTLIFTMAAAGNLGAMLSFTPSRDNRVFTYNFSKLTVATSVLYGYAGVVPLVGWAISKWMFSAPFGLIELICVYGYSLSVFIPASLLCVIPNEILRWLIIGLAFGSSVRFITRNVKDVVVGQLDDQKALMVLLLVGGLHAALAIFLKLYFYS
jgi:hypothetical protein